MLQSFTAAVMGCEKGEKGWEISLDATAFYPEGGGQACDTGSLGGVRVLDVQERAGLVTHLCDGPLEVGAQVAGSIDWTRRFDLMQQHTGEHILSGLIFQRYGYHNVGFHVGREVMEVDFDGPIPADALMELEAQANEAVWADLPLHCWYPAEEELPTIAYRTKRALPWPVRIVEIPGIDRCACCGIHVERTGQVGLIKLLGCTKFHAGVRLEMLCGQRAYEHACGIYAQNRSISQQLSARMLETAQAVEHLAQQLASEKLRSAGLQKQVLAAIAAQCVGRGEHVYFTQDLAPLELRELAQSIAGAAGTAAVFSGTDDTRYSFCFAGESEAAAELGRTLCEKLHARGGGRDGFFQGSVRASEAQIRELL